MRSESSRRRTSDRKPVPVVVLGTIGVLVIGAGLLAFPAGGAVGTSAVGRVWLYALVFAAVVGALGAGDPNVSARRRSRRVWAAGLALFALTLTAPLALEAVNRNESALALLLAGSFSILLAGSLGALGGLILADRRRSAREARGANVRRRRLAWPARSRAAGSPGSRRARP